MGTIITIGILSVMIVGVIGSMIRRKKKGESLSCGGDCRNCNGHCH